MILIYKLVFLIIFILAFPFLFLFPRIRKTIPSRLYPSSNTTVQYESIWFHGASAGDILSIKPIIDIFYNESSKTYNILITSNTESGRDIVKRYFPEDVRFAFMPFDIPFSVRKFLRIYRPKLLFIEASEFWPVIIHSAYNAGTRIILLNGNIKKERLLLYRMLSFLSSNPFKRFELMIVRNKESAESALHLGVEKDRIVICGNTKYQNVFKMKSAGIPPLLIKRFSNIRHLVVFGSIHYEEEEEISKTISRLTSAIDDISIVIAPRHMERVQQLIKVISSKGISVSMFSENKNTRIIILDTIGDLFYIYSFAYVAFVGGSLFDRGGHNLLEPAVWGVPVITGRYIRNYEDIARELLGSGLIIIDNAERLTEVIVEIIKDENEREKLSSLLSERINTIKSDFLNLETTLKERFLP